MWEYNVHYIHATTSVSTPKKQNLSHIVFSDSDISDIEADEHHHNQSYICPIK